MGLMDFVKGIWGSIAFWRSYPRKSVITEMGYNSRIRAWQMRQRASGTAGKLPPELDMTKKDKLAYMLTINTCINKTIRYVKDDENFGVRDYWQTFGEVALKKTGDCEDQAIAKWGWLRPVFGDDNVGMVIVKGHCMCCVYFPNDNDFWVLDNGYLSKIPLKASMLFPYQKGDKRLVPLVGFNQYTTWGY